MIYAPAVCLVTISNVESDKPINLFSAETNDVKKKSRLDKA